MKARFFSALAIAAAAFALLKSFAAENPGYAVHEWGTFTSVQGADGKQMEWNPLVAPELPSFIHDEFHNRGNSRNSPFVSGKTGMFSLQRLETPVLYFYSDRSRYVDAFVCFPEGTMTEWFPGETEPRIPGTRKTTLRWDHIQLLGKEETRRATLPSDPSGSHYYAARETDSSVLEVAPALSDSATEMEKFLFYRGLGDFKAPLTVTLDPTNSRRVTLTNGGREELRNLFLCHVDKKGGEWLKVDRLSPGMSQSIVLPDQPSNTALPALAGELRAALVHEGLYEREAAAMVKTWETSWFSEQGMRVLYTLPRPWTDEVLPLILTPAPKDIQRVMVGRAEIITPEMEQALLKDTERYVAAKATERPEIVKHAQELGLGRFMEPTLRRVMNSAKRSNEFSSLSWEMLQAASAPPKASAPAAQ